MTQVTAGQTYEPPPGPPRPLELLEGAQSLVTGIRPGLEIRGMDRGETPIADWLCGCGRHDRATGRSAVQRLTARVVVGNCPHRQGIAPVVRLDSRRGNGGAR